MTLGEKLKEARKRVGLSQEQLSEKLNVSRSAVAKWETDKGFPDIENLKALSQLLGVDIDYLVNDGESLATMVIRESIDLSKYEKGSRRAKKNKIIKEKYPVAKINPLIAKTKLTKGEKLVDAFLWIFTDAPLGTPELINDIKNADKQYYLVEQEEKQLLVLVTDEMIICRELEQKQCGAKFEMDGVKFTKCSYEVK